MMPVLNLNAAMTVLAMGQSWTRNRMKAIRFNRESSIPEIVFIDTKQDSCAESGAIGLVTGSFKLEKKKRQERCA